MSKNAENEPDEVEFELITNVRQLAPPPPLRKESVDVEEWPTTSGKAARFLVWELTAADWAACVESGWTYGKDGSRQKYDQETADIRYLSWVIRDQNGHRLWSKAEDAKPVLGQLGRSTIEYLVAAGNRMNSAREASKAKNFEKTRSAS